MTNKERMLHMVLDDPKLQELYDYDKSEYEDLYQALNSENVIVAAVARIIKYLDGKPLTQKMSLSLLSPGSSNTLMVQPKRVTRRKSI